MYITIYFHQLVTLKRLAVFQNVCSFKPLYYQFTFTGDTLYIDIDHVVAKPIIDILTHLEARKTWFGIGGNKNSSNVMMN